MGAEIDLEHQINYINAQLQYEPKENLVLNPFIGYSNSAILKEIRRSLLELKELKCLQNG